MTKRYLFVTLLIPTLFVLAFSGREIPVRSESSPTTQGGGNTADTSWQARSTAPGVILSEGFDNLNLVTFPSSCGGFGWPTPSNPQCYNPALDGTRHVFLDQSIYSSGDTGTGNHRALRLDATNVAGANVAGDYFIRWPQVFSQNSHFYVQYRMRMHGYVSNTAPWVSPDIGGQGWKTMVFAGRTGPLCGGVELATVNFYYQNILRLYTRCGGAIGDSFDLPADGLYGYTPNWRNQQGDYNGCAYNGTPNIQTDCAMFHGDQWMTFYYDVQVGTFGLNNSYVKAYVDYSDGLGYRQWIDAPNYKLSSNGSPSDGWGLADFTNYNTGKSSSAPSPSTYSTWYDEFILSTQPIAAPSSAPMQILTSSLPSAIRLRFYYQSLQASGGSGGYVWSISSGALPAGLRLDSTTGVIRGRARLKGTWNFTVTAQDSQNASSTASQAFTVISRLSF